MRSITPLVVFAPLLLFTIQTYASVCRSFNGTTFNTDTSSSFSNTLVAPLVNVNCPQNKTKNPTPCAVPRGLYTVTVQPSLSVTVSNEDKSAILEAARVAFFNSANRGNATPDAEWGAKERIVDTRTDEWGTIFYETQPGLNYTLYFLAFARWGTGTLGGCDNATLNGQSVRVAVPYEAKNARNNNVTEVAGTLLGSGSNTTKDDKNAAGRLTASNAGLFGLVSLGIAMGIFL